jgi:hypothetical protein
LDPQQPSEREMIVSHAFRKADNFSSQTDLLVIKLTIMCQCSCLGFVHAFAQKSGFRKVAFEFVRGMKTLLYIYNIFLQVQNEQ